jgi:hypothetical protein
LKSDKFAAHREWEAVMERASASGITLAGFYVAAKVKFCEMGVIPAASCAASITASHKLSAAKLFVNGYIARTHVKFVRLYATAP